MRHRAAILLLAVGLAGCAAREAPPPTPAPAPSLPAAPWTAAIGRLDIADASPCTAILVKPTLILTAAHCLHQKAVATLPADLHFNPNLGADPAFPAVPGKRIVKQGGDIREGHLARPEQVMEDWALIEIGAAVTGVAPLPLTRLTADQVTARIAQGDQLFTAGYGQGWTKRLERHHACKIVDDPKIFDGYRNRLLVTNCIIRIGDSGGPVALLDAAGNPTFIGIFAGFDTKRGLSYAVTGGAILPKAGGVPVSALPAGALPLVIFMPDQRFIDAVTGQPQALLHRHN